MSSVCCAEPMEATAMLQENNNNNYSCLERACENREALQEQERVVLPIAKLLEMGSFPELGDVGGRAPARGFRAWAMGSVCGRSRRWAALPHANPMPFLRRPDTTKTHVVGDPHPQMVRPAQGRPGVGLGIQLDAGSWNGRCGSRRGTLGALVTVATLKASERGGQTQTQCFLLQAKGQSYLCTAGGRRTPAPGLYAELTSAPVVYGPGDTASSEKRPDSGKSSKQKEGKDKPRPVRKWRTSCEVAFSVKERVPWEQEGREFPVLGVSQENRSEHVSQTSAQDTQTRKRESPGAETSGTAKTCTQCSGETDGSAIGLRRTVEDSDWSSSGVEQEEVTSPMSGSLVCCLDPDPADRATGCSPTDCPGPIDEGMQDESQAKSFSQKISRFQDLLGDKSPRLGAGSKSEVSGAVRNAGESEADLIVGNKALKETGSSADKETGSTSEEDPESSGGGDSLQCVGGVRGGLPCGHMSTEGPRSHGSGEDGLPSPTFQSTHLGTGSNKDLSPLAEDIQEQKRQSVPCDGSPDEVGGDTGIGDAVWITRASVKSPDRVAVNSSHPPEHVELTCESRAGVSRKEESGLSEVLGGGDRGGHGSPVAGGQRETGAKNRDTIWRLDNSLSRGLDSAATDTHAPPSPTPPGTMATALSSLDGRQDGVSLPSLGETKQQGGTVASVQRDLSGEQEGDDDFGLFVQAGEQTPWDDGFTDFQQVPYGTSESADPVSECEPGHWTCGQADNAFHQSEDTWTAFSLEGSISQDPVLGGRPHMQPGEQWWPQKAAEEFTVKLHAPFDLPSVFQEAFPSTPSRCPSPDPVPTLRSILQGLSSEDQPVGDSGSLLDGLQDVNRIIGLKYRWAESHSQKLLLHSLHLDMNNKGHVTSSAANDSPSEDLPPLGQHTSPTGFGKTKISHDIEKNVSL